MTRAAAKPKAKAKPKPKRPPGKSMAVTTTAEVHDAAPLCGAQARTGGRCTQPAGWGTDHAGQGRCKLHGGASPITHGRYSTITRTRIRELYDAHVADPNPLDTLPELALARAALQDFLERYDVFTEALLAWHASWRLRNQIDAAHADALRRVLDAYEADAADREDGLGEGQEEDLAKAREVIDALLSPDGRKPRQVLDISDAVRHVNTVSQVVERIERVRAGNHVTYEQLRRFLFALERVLEARIPDARLLAKVRDDILAIQVA